MEWTPSKEITVSNNKPICKILVLHEMSYKISYTSFYVVTETTLCKKKGEKYNKHQIRTADPALRIIRSTFSMYLYSNCKNWILSHHKTGH